MNACLEEIQCERTHKAKLGAVSNCNIPPGKIILAHAPAHNSAVDPEHSSKNVKTGKSNLARYAIPGYGTTYT